MKLKHYGSEYPKHKRAHSVALRAPQIMPMTGDGPQAALHSRRGWRYANGVYDVRAALVEARYRDWLDERNVALSPFAAVVTLLGGEG